MTGSQGGGYSRRRRRASSRQGPPPAAARAEKPAPSDHPAPTTQAAPKQRRAQRASRDSAERGLHDLVGGGKSQLGVSAAVRGRDVNRPTEEDIAEAERDVEIVRRHWQPAPAPSDGSA